MNLLFKWAKYYKRYIPELELLHNIPKGVKAGVPHVFWPFPKNGYHGFYIYIFSVKTDTTYSQDFWIERLTQRGFLISIAKDHLEAKNQLLEYYNKVQ